MHLPLHDNSFCSRRNVYFGSGNCVGIGCLKARRGPAAARASHPPGKQHSTKRKRTGDQTSRNVWMGKAIARKRAVDAMALGGEEREKADRNTDAADAWLAGKERRLKQRREDKIAEEAEDLEDESWGPQWPAPKTAAPKTPPRRPAPKTPPKQKNMGSGSAKRSAAPQPPAYPPSLQRSSFPENRGGPKPKAAPRPPAVPPPPAALPPPRAKAAPRAAHSQAAPKAQPAPKGSAAQAPQPPQGRNQPWAARSQAAGSQRTEDEKMELIHERRMALLELAAKNKEKNDEAKELQDLLQRMHDAMREAQASRGATAKKSFRSASAKALLNDFIARALP